MKADIWSLGCILYNLIYGQAPFGHIKDVFGKYKAITDPNFKIRFPAEGLAGRAEPEMVECLKLCLNRDPSKRPTAKELLERAETW